MTEYVTITHLENRRKSPAFEPGERGSVSTYSTPYGLPEFCGRYVNLQNRQGGSLEDNDEAEVSVPLARGSILHLYWEYYHKDPKGPLARFALDPKYAEAQEAADRLWKHYTQRVPRNAFGPTIMSEQVLPQTQLQRMVVESVTGATFKFITDALVYLDESQIARLEMLDDTCQLQGPGIYVIDLKSEGRTKPDTEYTLGISGTAYYACTEALSKEGLLELPDAPLQGTIFVRVIDLKTPAIKLTFVPPPEDEDVLAVRNFFEWRARQIRENVPNYAACRGIWGKPCWYLRSGQCKRGAIL